VGITLSTEQERAVTTALNWWRNRRVDQPVFRLFGYAGTGKSTVLETLIRRLGLTQEDVLFMAPTGKAASVMTRKGVPALTIHKTFYRLTGEDDTVYLSLMREAESISEKLANPAEPNAAAYRRRLVAVEDELRSPSSRAQPQFVFLGSNPVGRKQLLVIDEASMVQNDWFADLQSLGLPLILLGDDGQLPAVEGPDEKPSMVTSVEPDVRLTTVHRQDGESSILSIATAARNRQLLAFECRDDGVEYADGRGCRTPEEIERRIQASHGYSVDFGYFDQIIVGRHKTRHAFNDHMRQKFGITSALPVGGNGEKIVVTRNFEADDGTYLANGTEITVRHDAKRSGGIYPWGASKPIDHPVTVTGIDGKPVCIEGVGLWRYPFEDPLDQDYRRKGAEEKYALRCMQAQWAFAITAHKAQGSEWDKVCVIDESWAFKENAHRWRYTAYTRARKHLLVIQI
jgi:exodeoxyribonuclease V